MYELGLRESVDIENSSLGEYYEAELNKLFDEMFLTESHIEREEEWEKKRIKIGELYSEAMSSGIEYGIPDLYDVIVEVETYNSDIIWDIAALDYKYGRYSNMSYFGSEYYDSQDYTDEEVMDELYSAWCEDVGNSTCYGEETICLISLLLSQLRYSFTAMECPHSYYNSCVSNDAVVVVNDCQNFLIKEWHLASLAHCGDIHEEDKLLTFVISES